MILLNGKDLTIKIKYITTTHKIKTTHKRILFHKNLKPENKEFFKKNKKLFLLLKSLKLK